MVVIALLIANTINVAADLGGVGKVAQMMSGINLNFFVVMFSLLIKVATIRCRYVQIAGVLKWLTLILFAYVITAFVIRPDWGPILRATFKPELPHGHEAWAMLVAILGTTISPYLFFWQASQEVEEKKAKAREWQVRRRRATIADIWNRGLDVGVGTLFSNLVMFLIIVTTAFSCTEMALPISKLRGRQRKPCVLSPGRLPRRYILWGFWESDFCPFPP
jgi:Mn2+/Fe2+ NRAMP family transporter